MKRHRRNPANAALHVFVRKHSYGQEKSLCLEAAGTAYWLDVVPLIPESARELKYSHWVEVTIELPGQRKGTGSYALGWFNEKTGRFTWHTRSRQTNATLDEYGGIIDLMMRWFFDQNMPPRGVDEATYDVEV